MSSSRANAAARQRRAGDTQSTPQQSSYNSSGSKTRFVQQQQEPPQPPTNPKLSISDAIALITLRLGRVETIVSNYDPNAGSGGGNHQMNYDENMRMVDQQVFNSIVSRLDALEKGRNVGAVGGVIEQRLGVLEKNQKMLIERQQQTPVVVTQAAAETMVVNGLTEEQLKPMEESIESVKSELSSLKDLLLKLQSFTMETNQKLADIVFDAEDKTSAALNNAFMMSLHNTGFNMNMDGGIKILDDGDNENEQDMNAQYDPSDIDTNNTFQSTNLKELVKQELMNEESVVEEGAPAML
jgi:hypothetical protein